ncbi:MAG: DUF493 domain-containing protein [Gammaproteobacteria bacterium]|nr:DUF493 domain-containing protein [Gammaproteobacteria bacterium]MDH5629631.1 DUF493 domain-containing protein [Gammaproteobacteria bacterium]
MTDMTEEEAIQQLWQFPCDFLFKAMAFAQDGVEEQIIAAIQKHAPGEYIAKSKPSRNGNYVAVSVNLVAKSKDHLDKIYREVNALDCVKLCL